MHETLTATIDAYFDAWVNGRIGEMVGYLTEDSAYHPMNSTTVEGRETLRAYYQDFVDNYDVNLDWQYEAAEAYGDAPGAAGYVMGQYFIRYAPKGESEPIARGGRFYMHMELKTDGQWRISRELTQPTEDKMPGAN